MRDRFPLLVLGGLILLGFAGSFLFRGAARGSFADTLSTYRSEKDGARGLYLLAQESGLQVARVQRSLEVIDPATTLVMLGVEWDSSNRGARFFDEEEEEEEDEEEEEEDADKLHSGMNRVRVDPLNEREREKVLEHVRNGGTLVFVPWDDKDSPLLDALDVYTNKADRAGQMRTLVPAQPSPYTLDVERVETEVRVYLDLPEDAVPLLLDEGFDEVVAAVVPYGQGRVVLVGAPHLAMNEGLARADNAQFWLSLLRAVEADGELGFDEFHHGFNSERSIAEFGARYGLHFAAAQLLLGLCMWAFALRRFGRPRPPPEDIRVGATDALFASSRLYREGRHYPFAANLLVRGVTQEFAAVAGVSPRAEAAEVAGALAARKRGDLAHQLLELVRLAGAASSDAQVQEVAARCAAARQRVHRPRRRPAKGGPSPVSPSHPVESTSRNQS